MDTYLIIKSPKVSRNICCSCGGVTYRSDFGDCCMRRCHSCEAKWEAELITWSEPFWTETYTIRSRDADLFSDVAIATSSNPDKKMLIVTGKRELHLSVYERLGDLYNSNNALYCEPLDRFLHSTRSKKMKAHQALLAEADKWDEQHLAA